MPDAPGELVPNCVLIAFDGSSYAQAALEAAAALAAELQAELRGLFVENIDLLRLAGLPFATEVAYASAAPRRLDPARLERTLQANADEARRALVTAASQVRVQWSFQVARGQVIRASLDAAAGVDFLILGLQGGAPGATTTGRPTSARRGDGRPTLVLYDGSPAGERALNAAARLAREDGAALVVLLAVTDRDAAEALRRQATRRLHEIGIVATVDELPLAAAAELVAAARRRHAKTMVLNLDSPLLDEEALENLVNRLRFPVILVR